MDGSWQVYGFPYRGEVAPFASANGLMKPSFCVEAQGRPLVTLGTLFRMLASRGSLPTRSDRGAE